MFDYLLAVAVCVFAAKVRRRNGWVWGGTCLFLIGIGRAYIELGGGNSLLWTALVVAGLLLFLGVMKPGEIASRYTGEVKNLDFDEIQQDVLLTGLRGSEELALVQLAALLKLDADGLKDRLSAGPFGIKKRACAPRIFHDMGKLLQGLGAL